MHGLEDVQRLYLLLCPKVHEGKSVANADTLKRLLVVGRKKLPPIKEGHTQKDRVWCFVETVSKDINSNKETLVFNRKTTDMYVLRRDRRDSGQAELLDADSGK